MAFGSKRLVYDVLKENLGHISVKEFLGFYPQKVRLALPPTPTQAQPHSTVNLFTYTKNLSIVPHSHAFPLQHPTSTLNYKPGTLKGSQRDIC